MAIRALSLAQSTEWHIIIHLTGKWYRWITRLTLPPASAANILRSAWEGQPQSGKEGGVGVAGCADVLAT